MTIDEALQHADEWTKGATFHEGQMGWRPAVAVLAAEVRRLREALELTLEENTKLIRALERIYQIDDEALNFSRVIAHSALQRAGGEG